MKRLRTSVFGALALAGAVFCLTAPAKADIAIGFSFGYDGGYFNDPCDYYDYYDVAPPWGLPPDYCEYPVYFEPIYVGGSWYRGPIYYRWYGGERMYWIHGRWRRDEWRGARPQIRWNDRGGWHARSGWDRDGWRGGWNGRNDFGRHDFGRDGRDGWSRGDDRRSGWTRDDDRGRERPNWNRDNDRGRDGNRSDSWARREGFNRPDQTPGPSFNRGWSGERRAPQQAQPSPGGGVRDFGGGRGGFRGDGGSRGNSGGGGEGGRHGGGERHGR